MKTKQQKTDPLPEELRLAFNGLGKALDSMESFPGDHLEALIIDANDALQRAIDITEAQAEEYSRMGEELGEAQHEAEKFENRLDKAAGLKSAAFSLLGKLRDPSNWTDNKWAPVEAHVERDILLFLDQAFGEV